MPKKPTKSKRFKYNLNAVLKIRKIRENQEQEKFAEAKKKAEEEKRKEEELKYRQNAEYDELRHRMSTGQVGDVGDIMRRKAHLETLKVKVDDQIKVREEAEEKREEQREVLVSAVKDRKIMERDKEKKRVVWKKFMDKEEAKFLDDIATVGYVLRKRKKEESDEKGLETE